MTKGEIRMTKELQNSNDEWERGLTAAFGISLAAILPNHRQVLECARGLAHSKTLTRALRGCLGSVARSAIRHSSFGLSPAVCTNFYNARHPHV
jgi:hypothetical protein